jgi:hypothetical protein
MTVVTTCNVVVEDRESVKTSLHQTLIFLGNCVLPATYCHALFIQVRQSTKCVRAPDFNKLVMSRSELL